jgi:hypothetical protein
MNKGNKKKPFLELKEHMFMCRCSSELY